MKVRLIGRGNNVSDGLLEERRGAVARAAPLLSSRRSRASTVSVRRVFTALLTRPPPLVHTCHF